MTEKKNENSNKDATNSGDKKEWVKPDLETLKDIKEETLGGSPGSGDSGGGNFIQKP